MDWDMRLNGSKNEGRKKSWETTTKKKRERIEIGIAGECREVKEKKEANEREELTSVVEETKFLAGLQSQGVSEKESRKI
jgi:hypothetical protein